MHIKNERNNNNFWLQSIATLCIMATKVIFAVFQNMPWLAKSSITTQYNLVSFITKYKWLTIPNRKHFDISHLWRLSSYGSKISCLKRLFWHRCNFISVRSRLLVWGYQSFSAIIAATSAITIYTFGLVDLPIPSFSLFLFSVSILNTKRLTNVIE